MGNLLDKLFEDKLKSRNPAFDQEDWVKMEALLVNKGRKRRMIPLWLSLLIGALVVISVMSGIYLLDKQEVEIVIGPDDLVASNKLTDTQYDRSVEISRSIETIDKLDHSNNKVIKNDAAPILKEMIPHSTMSDGKLDDAENIEYSADNITLINSVINDAQLMIDFSELPKEVIVRNLDYESINLLPQVHPIIKSSERSIENALFSFTQKPIKSTPMKPEFGLSASFIHNEQSNVYDIGFYKNIGIGSKWVISMQGLYTYMDFEPFLLAQDVGNIYSFDVSNYEQKLYAQYAHGISMDLSILYQIGSSRIGLGLHEQYVNAVKSDRIISKGDSNDQMDHVWTDHDLYDVWQLSTRLSYEYTLSNALRIGSFYNYQLGENSSFNPNNNFGINLKWSL